MAGFSDGSSQKVTIPKPKSITVKLQSGTDRTVFATWKCTGKNIDKYQTIWYYNTGDGVWFSGNDSTTTNRQSTYSAPSNAKSVKFQVKPVCKAYKVNGKTTAWVAAWSKAVTYSFSKNPPTTPSNLKVSTDQLKLTAELDNLDVNATHIQFEVVRDDTTRFKIAKVEIVRNHASYSCNITPGYKYKVRCRANKSKEYSAWSEYSDNVETIPATPTAISECRALSPTSVYLAWNKVANADSYEIEYTDDQTYFDSSTEVQSATVDAVVTHSEITGLESGAEYYFRVRAVNSIGKSGWAPIARTICGKIPSAPSTWSSTTTAMVGEALNLYWVHNSEDGSSQTYGQIELTVGSDLKVITVKNSTDEDEKDKTSSYSVTTSGYREGTKILWRVRTRGVMPDYGEWSIQRTVDIYAPPVLELGVTDINGNNLETLEAFPFYVNLSAGPNTQTPIGYHLSVISDEPYMAVDQLGNERAVNAGDEVYSQYFNADGPLTVELSAQHLDLENNVPYRVVGTVSMNSGLTAEAQSEFTVEWEDGRYFLDAAISVYDGDFDSSLVTAVRPYCSHINVVHYKVNKSGSEYIPTEEAVNISNGTMLENTYTTFGDEVYSGTTTSGVSVYYYETEEEGDPVDGVTLSVYRREFDGGFTELATGIDSLSSTYITDPHPALDYARYRIVAIENATGAVSYYDTPGYPIGEKSVIFQWGEEWNSIHTLNEDEMEEPLWSGSSLRLPYNIDVSDNYAPDSSLVEYIGREYPVSYYGTQKGLTSTWNVAIPKSDSETLYTLRRLAIWMGDIYVREPSGSGYWANITVSFSQKHCEKTIPVTFNITRVSGGA